MNVAEIITTSAMAPGASASAQVRHIRWFFGPHYWAPGGWDRGTCGPCRGNPPPGPQATTHGGVRCCLEPGIVLTQTHAGRVRVVGAASPVAGRGCVTLVSLDPSSHRRYATVTYGRVGRPSLSLSLGRSRRFASRGQEAAHGATERACRFASRGSLEDHTSCARPDNPHVAECHARSNAHWRAEGTARLAARCRGQEHAKTVTSHLQSAP